MKKVAFYTLGCKLNFSETSALSKMLADDNYLRVEFEESADDCGNWLLCAAQA